MKSTEIKDIVNSRILKTVKLPIEFENCDNPIIFKLLNSSLEKRHQRKQLLLPNFENTDTVAIFSDYGGESKDSKYYRNLLGGLYRENPVKSRNYEAVKSSKKWENVGNSYIIPALLLYRYSYI